MSSETVRRICLCVVLTALCLGGLASGEAQALPGAPETFAADIYPLTAEPAAPLTTSGWIPPTTTRVSVASDGNQGDAESYWTSISADGRYIAFHSFASLVPDDTNNHWDAFVHDRQTGETTRVSVSSGGQANSSSSHPSISADGRYVAFRSGASNLVPNDTPDHWHIYVHDRQTGQTIRVSVSSDGREGNGDSWGASISANGRYVAFYSKASNLA